MDRLGHSLWSHILQMFTWFVYKLLYFVSLWPYIIQIKCILHTKWFVCQKVQFPQHTLPISLNTMQYDGFSSWTLWYDVNWCVVLLLLLLLLLILILIIIIIIISCSFDVMEESSRIRQDTCRTFCQYFFSWMGKKFQLTHANLPETAAGIKINAIFIKVINYPSCWMLIQPVPSSSQLSLMGLPLCHPLYTDEN